MAYTGLKLSAALNVCSPTIHPSGLVNIRWGTGCSVREPVNIYSCTIGDRVRIGPFVEIQRDAIIGDDTVISSHSFICGGCRIGSRVFVGHGVLTCNDRYPMANNPEYNCLPPTIEDDVALGSGCIILPGVRIGTGALIGAGAIVRNDVPDGLIVKGVW